MRTIPLLLLTACCLLSSAWAEPRPQRFQRLRVREPRPQYQFRSQLDAGPKLMAERQALDRLAAAKSWDEWLRRYQRLLDEHPDGLLPAGQDRLVGLRRTVQERLRSLPAAVRERYRQQYDGRAAAALERAVSKGEPDEVTRVYARFRYTSAGPRALAWLAGRALDGGDSERAWLAFSRLVSEAGGAEPELPTWMAKAILAAELAGRTAEAGAMAERLVTRMGDRPLKIAGRSLPARDWTTGRRGDGATGRGEGPNDSPTSRPPDSRSSAWPDFAGGPEGTRTMSGAVGVNVRLAWQEVVTGTEAGMSDSSDGGRPLWGRAYRNTGVPRFSHLTFPTLSDGLLFAQAPGRIRAISVIDGKVVWSAREVDLASQRRFPTPGGFRWWRPQRATQTVTPVAGRLLLVRLPAGRFENDSSGWPAEFVLAALDARTGALLWQRSAADGPPDTFYNLPTVSGQTVYTGIATSMAGLTEYRAAALDAATGDRLWTTHLGSGSDPMAGVDGSPAAVRGDTVWVETCLHTVCALDALTGEVQWVVPFKPDTSAPERSGWQDTMNVTNEPVSLMAPAGDRLLFSPRWSSSVVALNAKTGHRAWSADTSRSRSLVAVNATHALLAGDELLSLDPATGRPQWTWTPPDRVRVGYPVLVGNRVVAPVGASLVFLDATSGEERGRRSLKEFGAQSGTATVLVMGRRLYFAQADRIIAVDETPDQSLARN